MSNKTKKHNNIDKCKKKEVEPKINLETANKLLHSSFCGTFIAFKCLRAKLKPILYPEVRPDEDFDFKRGEYPEQAPEIQVILKLRDEIENLGNDIREVVTNLAIEKQVNNNQGDLK